MTQTVQTGSTSSVSVYVTIYIGPETINTGDFGICQSYTLATPTGPPLVSDCTLGGTPFAIPAGVEDVDTFLLTLEDIFTITTTTNTDLLTQDYNLVGVPAVAPAPEPSSWALLGGSLLAMLWRRRKPIFRKLHTTRGSVAG
jgi:PEP-CTERM motif